MKRSAALFAAALLCSAGCSRQDESPAATAADPNVLARVGDAVILTDEFAARAAARRAPDSPDSRIALLDEMIGEEALVHRARQAGLDKTPAYRQAMRDFLIARLREAELPPLLERASLIGDDELAEAVTEAAARLGRPAAVRAAWLHLATEGSGEAESARLRTAVERWQSLPPDPERAGFGSIAAEFSDDGDTRYQGGDFGWLDEKSLAARLPDAAARAVAALRNAGEVSGPIAVPGAVCVVLLQDQRPALPADPEKIRERVRQDLAARRRADAEAGWRRAARAAAPVTVHEAMLQAVPLMPTADPQEAVPPQTP